MKPFKHNNILDNRIRRDNENYNLEFIDKLNINLNPNEYEGWYDLSKSNDGNAYHTVWLKNIDRLMNIIPLEINISQYHFYDVGCGLGISTLYFEENYKFKSYNGFDYSKQLIATGKMIINQLKKQNSINFFVGNANDFKLDKDKPYLLFMFNPFGLETFNSFLLNNLKCLKKNNSIILYANDLYINEIDSYQKIYRNDFFNLSVILF